MTVIDLHTHFLQPEVMRESAPRWVLSGFGTHDFTPPPPDSPQSHATRKMFSPAEHLADMDRLGIDRHVVSAATAVQGTDWAEPEHQAELERRNNGEAARWAVEAPDRLIGSFTLPLGDIELAMRELERATDELGLRVANLPAQSRGDYLGSPRFRPIWRELSRRGIASFIHPDGARDLWFQEYSLWNSIGQPIEEAKVVSSLILEGVLDELPDLKIVISHGGGFLPHYTGRLDRNVTNMPSSVRNISRLPSDYLRALYYDTCVYDVAVLEALVERVGADRLVLGSDYPVSGEPDHIGFVKAAGNVRPDELEQILGGTAERLLGL
jgi:aminocarboxymuconate-semialdehyde decarboxylase